MSEATVVSGGAAVKPEPDAPLLPKGYRPHLDGLRAVAVYLVVAFHSGADRLAGGFIGVDVFFVLSGFLVTQILIRDLAEHGTIRFGRFYARRVRRLLPASAVLLLIWAIFYTALFSPAEVADAQNGFSAAFLYVANWFFVGRSTGYFAGDVARSPLLHFWSLAVEEQFYLLWPLLLAALAAATARFGRHRWSLLRWVIAIGAACSLSAAFWLRQSQPDRAYFGTDTRAYQLLAGALLALLPGFLWKLGRTGYAGRLLAPLGLGVLLLLATDLLSLDTIERGAAVTIATVLLIASLEAFRAGPVAWVLCRKPLTYLGRISYGIYLWHWPVVLVIEKVTTVSPLPLAALVGLIATGIASLSYQLLELPIRQSQPLDRIRWPLVASSLTASVLIGLLLVPAIVTPNRASRPAPTQFTATRTAEGFTPIPANFDQGAVYFEKFGETVECVGQPADNCTVVRGSGKHVLLMGDSNAEMWIPAFTKLAQEQDLTLSLAVTAGCLWQRDAYKLTAPIIKICRRNKTDAYQRVIPELDPDLIILANSREPKGPPNATYTDDDFNRLLRRSTVESLNALAKPGRQILILEAAPTPNDDFNPLTCLGNAKVVENCRFVAETAPNWLETDERKLAADSDSLTTVDLDRLICPFLPICDPIIGDTVVFWNGSHITAAYSRSLAAQLANYLNDRQLIPSG